MRGLHWLLKLMNAIPVAGGNQKEVAESLERARQELQNGHVVCLFAEGAISRTGNLLPFKRGFERIIDGLDVPVIPVHLDRLWGSVFSFRNGKFFWKWPRRVPYLVTVSFGGPLPSSPKAQDVRQAIQELGGEAIGLRRSDFDLLHIRFLATARRRWFSFCMADSTGREMRYGESLAAAISLSRWIRQKTSGEKIVGVYLPASVGGVLANLSLYFAGKIPVNLNFTTGPEAIGLAINACGIKHLITSKSFITKAKLPEIEGMIFLENVRAEISALQKLSSLLTALLIPSFLLKFIYREKDQVPDSIATVIFSSGSTGTPKGVMLSHHNIISNVEALDQIFWVTEKDRVMGVLPFFHSFGLTGTLWFPLLSGFSAVYHPNPTDARTIGELSLKYKPTILISTPTFCSAYIRKCAPEEFSTLRFAFVGAERLREPIAKAFKEKFGTDLLEGYGCTELAPVVSANTPDVRDGSEHQSGFKPGTVGRPVPGVSVKVVNQETSLPLPNETEGLLLVKGPNQMLGYFNQPELTREVVKDGWYVTGDIGFLDNEGFIHITDRLSRFSKIGGEMVPHYKIEEIVRSCTGEDETAVIGVPDEQKGERLVLFYTSQGMSPDQIWECLFGTALPKLWIPKRENIYRIDALPSLGSGKTDLKKLKSMA
ncbi:MAG TPA: AMP-binding protein, partial [Nitrospiria bacterium]|nr:AMP-binding protein [Nitrospiria bacterium]